jgi:hypothetical protein
MRSRSAGKVLAVAFLLLGFVSQAGAKKEPTKMAYLEITLKVAEQNRSKAAEVYQKYRQPFLHDVSGAKSKQLLLRKDDVQVLHGFESEAQAESYLKSALFNNDVVRELKPLLDADPEIRIYTAL